MKKGDKVTMFFYFAGLVSEEDVVVTTVHRDGTVTVDDEWRFRVKTGECLNDNTHGGARRKLKKRIGDYIERVNK